MTNVAPTDQIVAYRNTDNSIKNEKHEIAYEYDIWEQSLIDVQFFEGILRTFLITSRTVISIALLKELVTRTMIITGRNLYQQKSLIFLYKDYAPFKGSCKIYIGTLHLPTELHLKI